MVVDAYNEDVPVAFYKKNGFDFMFSTEEQEKSYFLGGYEKVVLLESYINTSVRDNELYLKAL